MSSNKSKEVQNFIEQRRLERLEKAKQRAEKVRDMKLKKINSQGPSIISRPSKLQARPSFVRAASAPQMEEINETEEGNGNTGAGLNDTQKGGMDLNKFKHVSERTKATQKLDSLVNKNVQKNANGKGVDSKSSITSNQENGQVGTSEKFGQNLPIGHRNADGKVVDSKTSTTGNKEVETTENLDAVLKRKLVITNKGDLENHQKGADSKQSSSDSQVEVKVETNEKINAVSSKKMVNANKKGDLGNLQKGADSKQSSSDSQVEVKVETTEKINAVSSKKMVNANKKGVLGNLQKGADPRTSCAPGNQGGAKVGTTEKLDGVQNKNKEKNLGNLQKGAGLSDSQVEVKVKTTEKLNDVPSKFAVANKKGDLGNLQKGADSKSSSTFGARVETTEILDADQSKKLVTVDKKADLNNILKGAGFPRASFTPEATKKIDDAQNKNAVFGNRRTDSSSLQKNEDPRSFFTGKIDTAQNKTAVNGNRRTDLSSIQKSEDPRDFFTGKTDAAQNKNVVNGNRRTDLSSLQKNEDPRSFFTGKTDAAQNKNAVTGNRRTDLSSLQKNEDPRSFFTGKTDTAQNKNAVTGDRRTDLSSLQKNEDPRSFFTGKIDATQNKKVVNGNRRTDLSSLQKSEDPRSFFTGKINADQNKKMGDTRDSFIPEKIDAAQNKNAVIGNRRTDLSSLQKNADPRAFFPETTGKPNADQNKKMGDTRTSFAPEATKKVDASQNKNAVIGNRRTDSSSLQENADPRAFFPETTGKLNADQNKKMGASKLDAAQNKTMVTGKKADLCHLQKIGDSRATFIPETTGKINKLLADANKTADLCHLQQDPRDSFIQDDNLSLNDPQGMEITIKLNLPSMNFDDQNCSINTSVRNKSRKQWRSPKPLPINAISKNVSTKKSGLRRSLSATDIQSPSLKLKHRSKSTHRLDGDNCKFVNRPSMKVEHRSKSSTRLDVPPPGTPKACKTPKPIDLQKRLINWLKAHGKEVSAYKNLHLFGTRKSILPKTPKPTSDKENIIVLSDDEDTKNTTTNPLGLNETFDFGEDLIKKDTELRTAQSILEDLYSLILDNYPKDQCQQWLQTIKRRYDAVKELSVFWECKALLDTDEGDFKSAIDCYQKALVAGAEQLNVENKLCTLFDKMCSLNIDPKSLAQVDGMKSSREYENGNDFASSVIKFAVCKSRKNKNEQEDKTYFVTPVRRSSRLWTKTPTSATPFGNIQYVSSLNTLDENVRKAIKFTPNKAL
ncbi:uncharacterized protein LOC113389214 isoform X2 [Ctenocephalides felis]|uniref:uncharacterized protein LOC113389214 isoform X2 n=1 Tax=Ctenocephalides felis TaxID=7515 RepID=UPI000E6E102D|nr:uncharacterized protein LOC113389214 isoform X2 [Ctenocephalides felis]